jgi:hypothetical protein
MKIVQGDELQWERGLEHRGGTFHFRRLLDGAPGRIDNFHLTFGKMGGDFYSPRHRHNFEQVRFQLKGALDYDRDGKLTAGMVGYFPEGVFYGPQSQNPEDGPMTIVLQCGGASGSGYLSRDEVKAGMEALKAHGVFEDGVFRRNEAPKGKKSVDGFQAIWEHHNGRPLEFPKPRYNAPILMDPENYEWVPIEGAVSAYEKPLGRFTECGTSMACVKLDPGAEWTAEGRTILFTVSGKGTVDDQELRDYTTIHLDHDETVTLTAEEGCEVLVLGLPDLRPLMAAMDDRQLASAAE